MADVEVLKEVVPGNTTRDNIADTSEAARPAADQVPLLVDLDSCLIRTDLLLETAISYLGTRPLRAFHLLVWLFAGRSQLKRKLGEAASLDLSLIPIDETIADYARNAKRQGRQVYLVTASDEFLARKIATRFDFLDGVIASDGNTNLKGVRKSEVVRSKFRNGFDYIGDSNDDLHVWRHARNVIAVRPSASLLRQIQALDKPTEIVRAAPLWRNLFKAARPNHWIKNTLVFVPAILSGQIIYPDVAVSCVFAFLALCLVAFGTYLVNDLIDLSDDRRHWSKRNRPLASGQLSIGSALVAAPATLVLGLAIAAINGLGTLLAVASYLAVTLAYSFLIKGLPILDVFTLAGLFTLRLVIGIAATGVVASPWLLVFSMFLFTSLALAKRYTEIQRTGDRGRSKIGGRGYLVSDNGFVFSLGMSTATASVLIMVLYLTFDASKRDFYGNPYVLWVLPVILFLWVTRVWFVGHRGELHDDPITFALKDRQSLILGGIVAAAFVLSLAPPL